MPRKNWSVFFAIGVLACTSDRQSASTAQLDDAVAQSKDLGAFLEADSVPFDANNATAIRSGLFALYDGHDQKIAVFDSAGGRKLTFGRKGHGPGEFDLIDRLFSVSTDTLAVFDKNIRAISFFANGVFTHRSSFAPEWSVGSLEGTELVGRFADGRWVAFKTAPRDIRVEGVHLVVDTPSFVVGVTNQAPHELFRLSPRRLIDLNIDHSLYRVQFSDLAGGVGAVCDSGIVVADTIGVRYFGTDGHLIDSIAPLVSRIKSAYRTNNYLATNELHGIREGANRKKAVALIDGISATVDSSVRFGAAQIDVEGAVWEVVDYRNKSIYARHDKSGKRNGLVTLPARPLMLEQIAPNAISGVEFDTSTNERTWHTYTQPLSPATNQPQLGHCYSSFRF